MRWPGENPVLQRELLVNLRTVRSFVLLFVFQLLLGAIVVVAWPAGGRLDLTQPAETGRPLMLVDLFFLGNFVLASLMAPSFAAGSITGEKERKTYEMLLASPLHPTAIVAGKLVAALAHLAVLVFASLPVVMLCLPLGGVSPYEVFAAYAVLLCCLVMFGMISVACGSRFRRTSASLVASYLIILPLVLLIVLVWHGTRMYGLQRVYMFLSLFPGLAAAVTIPLFYRTAARLLYPTDVGSHGQEVLDLDREAESAVGLVINRDQFPDRLFAPPIRTTLMPDGTNPVYDKEMRSEIFGQGTLMLRMAIQISMVLAIIPMAVCLYVYQELAPWYICYAIVFNILVGPVFSAGSMTSERERQTLDLLLTTTISPWQILWGKLLSGFRVSGVLTAFLMWPVILALFTTAGLIPNFPAVVAWFLIVLLTCATSASVALFCSCLFRKSSASLLATYVLIIGLFVFPVAAHFFAQNWFAGSEFERFSAWTTIASPFAAAHEFPLYLTEVDVERTRRVVIGAGEGSLLGYPLRDLTHFFGYCTFTLGLLVLLFGSMVWLFNGRWRVASARG